MKTVIVFAGLMALYVAATETFKEDSEWVAFRDDCVARHQTLVDGAGASPGLVHTICINEWKGR